LGCVVTVARVATEASVNGGDGERTMRDHRGQTVSLPDRARCNAGHAATQLRNDWLPIAAGGPWLARSPSLAATLKPPDSYVAGDPAGLGEPITLDQAAGDWPLAVSRCERVVATISVHHLALWSTATGQLLRAVRPGPPATGHHWPYPDDDRLFTPHEAAFSPSGRHLAFRLRDMTYGVDWLDGGVHVHSRGPATVLFRDGTLLARSTGGWQRHYFDGTPIAPWPSREQQAQVRIDDTPIAMTGSPDDRRVAVLDRGEFGLRVRSLAAGDGRLLFEDRWLGERAEGAVADRYPGWFRDDGTTIEIAWENGLRIRWTDGPDSRVVDEEADVPRIYGLADDARTAILGVPKRTFLRRLDLPDGAPPTAITRALRADAIGVLSPSRRRLIVGGAFHPLHLLDLAPATDRRPAWYRRRRRADDAIVGNVYAAIACNGRRAVLLDATQTAHLLEVADGELPRRVARVRYVAISRLTLSPTGQALGVGHYQGFRTYRPTDDPDAPRLVDTFHRVAHPLGLSDDGQVVIALTGDRSRQVHLWKAGEPEPLHRFGAKLNGLLTADGRFIWTWDTPTIGDWWRLRGRTVKHGGRFHLRTSRSDGREEPSACLTPNGRAFRLLLPEGPRIFDPSSGDLTPPKTAFDPEPGRPTYRDEPVFRDGGLDARPWPLLRIACHPLYPVRLTPSTKRRDQ